ncbi:DUF1694 domain-containing protein [Pelosinus sp. sgz500959]|uniref:DUF1694 domain-containing protein n=1 Tax=Pelosinus sp. sgz500959 TaxID=3242472 RepID=UPI003671C871
MDKDIQSETISNWARKDNIEQALMVGMHGITEFKHDEKVYYLGEFKENVIRLLSQQQVAEVVIYPEIIHALKDKRATKMIINGSISIRFIEKYEKLARKMHKPYIVRSEPEFKGSTGLMVISDEAIETQIITVEDRSVRLKRLGMPSALINAVGKKVCKKCLQQILEVDPAEESNYNELTLLDRIGGEHCPAHQGMK